MSAQDEVQSKCDKRTYAFSSSSFSFLKSASFCSDAFSMSSNFFRCSASFSSNPDLPALVPPFFPSSTAEKPLGAALAPEALGPAAFVDAVLGGAMLALPFTGPVRGLAVGARLIRGLLVEGKCGPFMLVVVEARRGLITPFWIDVALSRDIEGLVDEAMGRGLVDVLSFDDADFAGEGGMVGRIAFAVFAWVGGALLTVESTIVTGALADVVLDVDSRAFWVLVAFVDDGGSRFEAANDDRAAPTNGFESLLEGLDPATDVFSPPWRIVHEACLSDLPPNMPDFNTFLTPSTGFGPFFPSSLVSLSTLIVDPPPPLTSTPLSIDTPSVSWGRWMGSDPSAGAPSLVDGSCSVSG